ncbi:putative membrane protein [Burkholderia thailandensis E444]|uniref:DUF5455 family protein n=1 Tax=Burkholderia thailandensis TaxID=57975 RepID=UPI0003EC7925|nr:DUF5455 family protein [Burkholderia thailandensis]AHI78418.1 putative membrane protein [Burkholderia thailandensis E444]AWY68328.1 hypothetical protein A8H36_25690 [Burkholderia thailandensis]
MQIFAGFLVAVFGKLFEFLASYVGKKIAIGSAVLATSLVLLTTFWIALKALVAGLMYPVTNQYILMAFYAFWPSNAEICMSAYWSAQLAAFIYREHRENLRAISYVS